MSGGGKKGERERREGKEKGGGKKERGGGRRGKSVCMNVCVRLRACACACERVHACVRLCMCTCACACVRARVRAGRGAGSPPRLATPLAHQWRPQPAAGRPSAEPPPLIFKLPGACCAFDIAVRSSLFFQYRRQTFCF